MSKQARENFRRFRRAAALALAANERTYGVALAACAASHGGWQDFGGFNGVVALAHGKVCVLMYVYVLADSMCTGRQSGLLVERCSIGCSPHLAKGCGASVWVHANCAPGAEFLPAVRGCHCLGAWETIRVHQCRTALHLLISRLKPLSGNVAERAKSQRAFASEDPHLSKQKFYSPNPKLKLATSDLTR